MRAFIELADDQLEKLRAQQAELAAHIDEVATLRDRLKSDLS